MLRHGVLAALVAGLVTVGATSAAAESLFVGGRVGLAHGAVWFEDEEANDLVTAKSGLQVGAVAAYRPRSVVSLQAELRYVQKGWTETPAGGSRRLTYLELPVLLTLTAPWKTAPQLIAGAAAGLELACSVGVPEVGRVGCGDPRVEWHRRKAQVSASLGIGVRRRLGRGYLAAQLLGNLHLTSLSRERLPDGFSRLLSLTVSTTYVIPLGGR